MIGISLGAECEHDHHRLLDAGDDGLRPAQEGQGNQTIDLDIHFFLDMLRISHALHLTQIISFCSGIVGAQADPRGDHVLRERANQDHQVC